MHNFEEKKNSTKVNQMNNSQDIIYFFLLKNSNQLRIKEVIKKLVILSFYVMGEWYQLIGILVTCLLPFDQYGVIWEFTEKYKVFIFNL